MRAALCALALAAALVGGPAAAHANLDDSAVEVVTVQWVELRRIRIGPAALYLGENVGQEPATWALTAMQVG